MNEVQALKVQVWGLQAQLAAAYERCRACMGMQERVLTASEDELAKLRTLSRATPRVSDGDLLPHLEMDADLTIVR